MLRALRHPNYRLFFLGQGVSLIGTWLSTTATSWLVLRLAMQEPAAVHFFAAATVLGIVRFASQFPMSLLAPAAGVLIDRWNRHHVLVGTQALSAVHSAVLAALTFSDRISVTQIVALSVFQGLINAFDAPARQAFVVELVETRDDLPNAIALNSSMFNGARLLGPALAGLMIARFGEAACFTVDVVSYLAVLLALLLMRLKPRAVVAARHSALRELREGFFYAAGFAPVRMLLILAALISATAGAYQTLMPIFADRVAYHSPVPGIEDRAAYASPVPDAADRVAAGGRGATVFGFMGAAVGVGALGGAIYLASRRTVLGLGRAIAVASALTGIAMAGFAATEMLWAMLVTSVLVGLGMIVTFASCNTLLQTIVEDDMRGRLMSFFIVAVMGSAPVGSVIAGWVAGRIGEPLTVTACGAISVLAAAIFMVNLPGLRTLIRPIYVRRGILPEMATGLAAADRLNTADER